MVRVGIGKGLVVSENMKYPTINKIPEMFDGQIDCE